MSKMYTKKMMDQIVKDILSNAFIHMETLIKELNKLHESDPEKLSPETQGRLATMNAVVTIVNDVVHPAHHLAYGYFKGYDSMLDMYVKNHKLAIQNKVLPECFNKCCDADGSKSKARAAELIKQEAVKQELAKKEEVKDGDQI